MKCSMRLKLVAVAVFLTAMLLAGSAWAADVGVWHETHVSFKKVQGNNWPYYLTPDYSTVKFHHADPRVSGSQVEESGKITLTPVSETTLKFGYKPDESSMTADNFEWPIKIDFNDTLSTATLFSTLPEYRTDDGEEKGSYRHHITGEGNKKGLHVAFDGDTALSGMKVSSDLLPSVFTVPTIVPIETWLEKCVPCIEIGLNEDGTKVTGVQWALLPSTTANPDEDWVWTTATPTGEQNSATNYTAVKRLSDGDIAIATPSGGFDGVSIFGDEDMEGFNQGVIPVGTPLRGFRDLTDSNIELKNVATVLIGVNYYDGVTYGWHFNNPYFEPQDAEVPDVVDLYPSAEALSADKNTIAGALGILSTDVIEVSPDMIAMGNDIDDYYKRTKTSTVIAIEQTVPNKGGVVLMGKTINLPINDGEKSESGQDLPELPDDATIDTLHGYYTVWKHFDNGSGIDLLDKFGSDLFKIATIDGKRTVQFTKTVAIVDNVAPDKAEDASFKPYGDIYGVELSGDFLYVYDGNFDGIAKDPIALQAVDGETSGSSGCDAGLGILGLLLVAGFAIKSRKA